MTPGDLLWLFFMFSALQPVLRQRFLEATRARLIARIERPRGSRVILLVHRQETMSILGFPVFRYIDVDDSEAVLRAIHLTDPEVPLDIVLHTPGGLVLVWTHDHPITYETARSFGLPVRSDIPSEFLDLMHLYPQPVRRQPSVEYLPEGRRTENPLRPPEP